MIKHIVSVPQTQELFCQKYWQKIRKQCIQNKNHPHPGLFDYSTYNHILLGINPFKCKKSLVNLDLSFKLFEPSKEKFTVWRGVKDPSYLSENIPALSNYYNKCKNIQPGEFLYMKEYPYVSCSYDYAKSFLSKDYENILFEIEIPKGTRLLYEDTRNVLQRCSKFLCTETKRVKDGEKSYQHIKLTLLPRDIQHDSELKENFLQRMFNKLHNKFGKIR